MRFILYKIIYAVIHLNQHCPLQNNIPLLQHIWPSEFFGTIFVHAFLMLKSCVTIW
jgi:hypothetical protein